MSWLGRVLGREQKTEERQYDYSALLSNLSRSGLSTSSVSVNSETALRLMAVWACIRVIAEDIASLPLQVYQRLDKGKERADNHPLYPLLHDAPNPEMTSMAFRETMTLSLLTAGNAYANIEDDGFGRPAALWPIEPSRVTVRRNQATNELEYKVQPVSGNAVILPLNRMFHIRGLSRDGVLGLSPIAYARDTIGLGMATEIFASSFFKNGARPSAVLEYPGQLSQEAHDRVISTFEDSYAGLSNAQRVALLEEGMKLNASYQMPLEDAQFLQTRQFSVIEICRLFRVHPHKIAVLEGSHSYASVEQANIDHVISTVRPWAVRWEQAITQQLILPFERSRYFAEFLITGLLRGDAAARGQFYKTMWEIGALSPNDIREMENLNAVDGGDAYYVPLNYGEVGAAPAGAVDTTGKPDITLVTGSQGAVA